MSPTQRSLAHMRKLGYASFVVEKWNSFTRRRVDLFGFLDLLCLGDGEVVGIQTTTSSNVPARVKKIATHDNVGAVRKAGIKIIVQGWRKNSKGKYVLREVDCS